MTEIAMTHTLRKHLERIKDDPKAVKDAQTVFNGFEMALHAMPKGPERARAVHGMIDLLMLGEDYKKASCTKGCSKCCHTNPFITKDEAALLARWSEFADQDRLKEAASWTGDTGEWNKQGKPCAFLSKMGTCRVYEDRPTTCRTYYVRSHPALCMTEKEVSVLTNPAAELIAAAAATVAGNGKLANLLLEEMEQERG